MSDDAGNDRWPTAPRKAAPCGAIQDAYPSVVTGIKKALGGACRVSLSRGRQAPESQPKLQEHPCKISLALPT